MQLYFYIKNFGKKRVTTKFQLGNIFIHSKDAQLIKQLIKQKYTLNDFILVIDFKVYKWLNDAEMKKFLRPSTLFGSKFDRYLNEAIPQKKVRRLG